MPSTLDEVDGVNVVGVDDPGAAQTAHNLSKDVGGDLAPGEVAEHGECECYRRVDVTSRDTARDPYTKGCTDCPSEVEGKIVL